MARRYDSPGTLRHRIAIDEKVSTDDGRGGGAESWLPYAAAWAQIVPVSARESFMMGQVQGAVSHRVKLRYQSGISFDMRVVYNSRVFQIVGIRNIDEESRWLELDCVEERL